MNEIDKALGGAGLLTFARSEIVRRIFSPIADEAGKALGTFGEIYRSIRTNVSGKSSPSGEHQEAAENSLKTM